MISVNSAAMRTFVFAGSLLCAAAQAGTQASREDASKPQARDVQLDANWATHHPAYRYGVEW